MLPGKSSSRRASIFQIALFAFLGLLAGLGLGYIFIGSLDRILSIQSQQQQQLRLQIAGREEIKGAVADELVQPQPVQQESIAKAAVESGSGKKTQDALDYPDSGETIHTLLTSNGSPYLNFQTRIMYGTYKLAKKSLGGDKLVAFTRILHRTTPDILMSEVPTFRADPLTPGCDHWCEFPVSDRPNAVAQFFRAARKDPSMIKAPWLLMLEGDYVWMNPMQAPRAESPLASLAFPYNYIQPTNPHYEDIMRIMYPADKGPLSDIPATGPAPVLMRVEEWIKITPDWERLTAHIESHKKTKKSLGWVREMYAFSIAVALQGVKLDLQMPPESPLMAQPPHDHVQGRAALLHYTWGTLVETSNNTPVWRFDKRDYIAPEIERKTPLIPLPPEWKPGWKLHEGGNFDKDLAWLTLIMIRQMNQAIMRLPVL